MNLGSFRVARISILRLVWVYIQPLVHSTSSDGSPHSTLDGDVLPCLNQIAQQWHLSKQRELLLPVSTARGRDIAPNTLRPNQASDRAIVSPPGHMER